MANTKTSAKSHRDAVKAYNNEMVPVFIRRPESETEDSITITLNGKNYQIMYDRQVMVPRKIALIVEEMQRNESKAEAAMRNREGMRSLNA